MIYLEKSRSPLPFQKYGAYGTSREGVKIFNHQPKQHQAKYVETNEEVDMDETVLKKFFGGCHISNVASGEYQNAVSGVKVAIKNRVHK